MSIRNNYVQMSAWRQRQAMDALKEMGLLEHNEYLDNIGRVFSLTEVDFLHIKALPRSPEQLLKTDLIDEHGFQGNWDEVVNDEYSQDFTEVKSRLCLDDITKILATTWRGDFDDLYVRIHNTEVQWFKLKYEGSLA